MSYSYVPGTCNLGKAEVRRRQFVALLGVFLTVSTAAGLIGSNAPTVSRWGLFAPLMVFSVGFIQSRKKFCLAYGFMGTFNQSPEDRKADRKTALTILAQSALLAVTLTAIFVVLPL
jgi:hypothetical protein